MARAQDTIDNVQGGEVSADLATIAELVNQQSSTASDSLSPALIILLVAWLKSS